MEDAREQWTQAMPLKWRVMILLHLYNCICICNTCTHVFTILYCRGYLEDYKILLMEIQLIKPSITVSQSLS